MGMCYDYEYWDTYWVGVGSVWRCLQDNRPSWQRNNCTSLEFMVLGSFFHIVLQIIVA